MTPAAPSIQVNRSAGRSQPAQELCCLSLRLPPSCERCRPSAACACRWIALDCPHEHFRATGASGLPRVRRGGVLAAAAGLPGSQQMPKESRDPAKRRWRRCSGRSQPHTVAPAVAPPRAAPPDPLTPPLIAGNPLLFSLTHSYWTFSCSMARWERIAGKLACRQRYPAGPGARFELACLTHPSHSHPPPCAPRIHPLQACCWW